MRGLQGELSPERTLDGQVFVASEEGGKYELLGGADAVWRVPGGPIGSSEQRWYVADTER